MTVAAKKLKMLKNTAIACSSAPLCVHCGGIVIAKSVSGTCL